MSVRYLSTYRDGPEILFNPDRETDFLRSEGRSNEGVLTRDVETPFVFVLQKREEIEDFSLK